MSCKGTAFRRKKEQILFARNVQFSTKPQNVELYNIFGEAKNIVFSTKSRYFAVENTKMFHPPKNEDTMQKMAKEQTEQAGKHLLLIDNVAELKNFQQYDLHFSNYVFIHILNGTASFCVNHEQYELAKNDLFICHPDIVLERTTVSLDVELRCTVLSPEYVDEMATLASENWDIRQYMDRRPILHLTEEDSAICLQYFTLLKVKQQKAAIPHQRELLSALLQAFIYEFHEMLALYADLPDAPRSSAEVIFLRFQKMLENTHPKPRKVGYYADQLNITTKYFSTICKRVSGRRAIDLITAAVVRDVENALRNTDLSVKEIADLLDFPNQSYFCAFVRSHLGKSPQAIRKGG